MYNRLSLGADRRCQRELSWAVMHSPQRDKALVLSELLSGQRSKSAGQSLQPSHLQSWEEEGKGADKVRLHIQMGSCCMHMGPVCQAGTA